MILIFKSRAFPFFIYAWSSVSRWAKVSSVNRLISTLVDICLLRAGPQQLPLSFSLLTLCLIAYMALNIVLARLTLPFIDPMLFALIDVALLLGFVWFLLSFKGFYSRFNQTAMAFAGSGVIMGLVAWALLSWQASFVGANTAVTLPALLLLFHLIWNLAVISSIVRYAISISLMWARGVALAYFFFYMIIIRLITVAFA